MSNAALNAHLKMGEPCGRDAALDEIADWAGESVIELLTVLKPLAFYASLMPEPKLGQPDWHGMADRANAAIAKATGKEAVQC